MNADTALRAALARDRVLAVAVLAIVVLASWVYLLAGAGMSMHEMDGMLMPMRNEPVTLGYAALLIVMWVAMMAAMMLPSAAPMILLFATLSRRRSERDGLPAASGAFMAGYLIVWIGFSLVAALLQIGLELSSVIDAMMQTANPQISAVLLVAAGLYQWTPLKGACLRSCQSPLEFLMTHWQPGRDGALRKGLRHGVNCVGCCWALMLLLLVGGVMSMLWILGIALFVIIEKLGPKGLWFSRLTGAVLIAWGLAVAMLGVWHSS